MKISPLATRLHVILLITLATILGCETKPTPAPATPNGVEQPAAKPPTKKPDVDATATKKEADVPAPEPKLLEADELAAGWISLFDGETLFGWKADSDANWSAKDGVISVDRGTKGLLHTTTRFADYELRIDFRAAKGTNSGIFLHTPPTIKDVKTDVYELNIAPPENPYPTGSLVKRKKVEGEFDSEVWHTYEITVSGDQVTIKLDEKPIMDYTDADPLRRGTIALQFNEGKVEFRNIKLKPLSLPEIFNGKDLEGWTDYPEMATKFTVNDEGHLRAKNEGDGRGQLETKQSYGDFVLQIDCKTHGKSLNSGIFFRSIPSETMNGYESQIQNGFKDGDRRKPEDCGTGGIFRRQNARYVVADDETWFHKTLIADGPHVAAWVNGYQVSDWTDQRKPDPNPRKGLRTEPGTIIIQGHDPTTDLSFRNIRAAELPKRGTKN